MRDSGVTDSPTYLGAAYENRTWFPALTEKRESFLNAAGSSQRANVGGTAEDFSGHSVPV